jgi:hypothetical protein
MAKINSASNNLIRVTPMQMATLSPEARNASQQVSDLFDVYVGELPPGLENPKSLCDLFLSKRMMAQLPAIYSETPNAYSAGNYLFLPGKKGSQIVTAPIVLYKLDEPLYTSLRFTHERRLQKLGFDPLNPLVEITAQQGLDLCNRDLKPNYLWQSTVDCGHTLPKGAPWQMQDEFTARKNLPGILSEKIARGEIPHKANAYTIVDLNLVGFRDERKVIATVQALHLPPYKK